MRKYLLLFLLLLIPSICFPASENKTIMGVADSSVKTVFGIATASVKNCFGIDWNDGDGADSCTGSLLLSWHAEDANVGTGTPVGCNSDADKEFTFAGSSAVSTTQKGDGTYSYLRADSGDTATITISSASASQGKVSFWIYSGDVSADNLYIAELNYDADDFFRVYKSSTNAITAIYYYGGSYRTVVTSALTANTAYNCSAYYSTAGSPYLHVECDGGITAGNQTNSVSAMTGAPTSLIVGGGTNAADDAYIDLVKVYNVYNP